ncbi:hypothetical protein [uncultured Deinococcus sp.]|uniref:hypothetical protein n=1 Tax=uncultured Deinococcus sp. TaxID=158789 RepID=UPI0025FDAAA7|nr:hypothetical protein [uncultured Deinococcus sp.]
MTAADPSNDPTSTVPPAEGAPRPVKRPAGISVYGGLNATRRDVTEYAFDLPEQVYYRWAGDDGRSFPAARFVLLTDGHSRHLGALENALALLRELFDVNLVDPGALRLLLTAHGHTRVERREVSLHDEAQSQSQT